MKSLLALAVAIMLAAAIPGPVAATDEASEPPIVVDHSVTLHVVDTGARPIDGVAIAGGPFPITTDAGGPFSFFAGLGETYTLTPSKEGYRFEPPSWTVSVSEGSNEISFVGSRWVAFLPAVGSVASPSDLVGAVEIQNGGVCCIGAAPGSTVAVTVDFSAAGVRSQVDAMRVDHAACAGASDVVGAPWEPLGPAAQAGAGAGAAGDSNILAVTVWRRQYQVQVPPGWSTFRVRVQYRDTEGTITPAVCDEVLLEGFFAP